MGESMNPPRPLELQLNFIAIVALATSMRCIAPSQFCPMSCAASPVPDLDQGGAHGQLK